MTPRTQQYPKTDAAIRAFTGPANARLRRMIRNSLQSNIDCRGIARFVALDALGKAKIDAVWQAWTAESTS